MPTYAYTCNTCGKEFERSQRMSEAPLTLCECGEKGQVTRQISAGSGLIFKGSGFYITDYKNGSNGAANTEGSKSDSAPAKDSAPAAAPAAGCGASQCCMANKTD